MRKTRKPAANQAAPSVRASALAEGVQAAVWPDRWGVGLKLKVDGGSLSFTGREYQVPIIRDESDWIVIPKGAQVGFTTVFLIRTFHWLIVRKWKHAYLLPLKAGSIPFVQGRVDPIIESNKALSRAFSSVDNRLHKQTVDGVNLYIRGTNIWTELREFPTDVIVFDERDKMVEDNVPEALARLDGSKIKRVVELSTPTAPGHGVDSEDSWHASDQHRWFVPCPHCNRYQTFIFEENVVLGDKAEECWMRCSHCHKEISDEERAEANARGYWEPTQLTGVKRGYHINQLNSPTQPITKFVQNYFEGLRDSKKMRAFFNNNLGQPYVAAGDQFTPELLDRCVESGHELGGIPNGPVFIGVDVGTSLHVSSCYLHSGRRIKWQMRIFTGDSMWDKLDNWLAGLGSFICVVDAHPEKTKARDLALKYHGRVYMGFEKDRPEQAEIADFKPLKVRQPGEVNIDRTMAFDSVIASYMDGRTVLPRDAREIGELMPRLQFNGFYHQMCQQVRIEEEDAKGRIVARWEKNKNPDHWHHADMFEWIASAKTPYVRITPEVGELFNAAGGVL